VANPDANCPLCLGQGLVVVVDPKHKGPTPLSPCECTFKSELILNLARIWNDVDPDEKTLDGRKRRMSALQKAARLPEGIDPALVGCPDQEDEDDVHRIRFTRRSCWITSTKSTFLSHLRLAAFAEGPFWNARRVTDADLLTSWLSTKIIDSGTSDPELLTRHTSTVPRSIEDLVLPPDLLILEVGHKNLANVEAPRAIEEAVTRRASLGKPTWLWDQPGRPFNAAMLSYSSEVEDFMVENEWIRLKLAHIKGNREFKSPSEVTSTAALPGGRRSLSSGKGGTMAAKVRPPADEKKRGKKR